MSDETQQAKPDAVFADRPVTGQVNRSAFRYEVYCSHCGGVNVSFEPLACWDSAEQVWVYQNMCHPKHCHGQPVICAACSDCVEIDTRAVVGKR